jgi:hypothetical protein
VVSQDFEKEGQIFMPLSGFRTDIPLCNRVDINQYSLWQCGWLIVSPSMVMCYWIRCGYCFFNVVREQFGPKHAWFVSMLPLGGLKTLWTIPVSGFPGQEPKCIISYSIKVVIFSPWSNHFDGSWQIIQDKIVSDIVQRGNVCESEDRKAVWTVNWRWKCLNMSYE